MPKKSKAIKEEIKGKIGETQEVVWNLENSFKRFCHKILTGDLGDAIYEGKSIEKGIDKLEDLLDEIEDLILEL
ncbi:MAG: hypothetical protein ACTSVW_00475 [Candidatus Njordarchaeales archaeon]